MALSTISITSLVKWHPCLFSKFLPKGFLLSSRVKVDISGLVWLDQKLSPKIK